nr:YetF domain-containing protein [Deinobacterium chartae]
MLLFRVSGKRTFSDMTSFDFVMLLIIAETTQQALLGDDFSITNALLLIVTLFATDVLLSMIKRKSTAAEKLLDGTPLLLVEHGQPLHERLSRARVDEGDILAAAREKQGLERFDQIKYAVLERNGSISIIPKSE